MENTITQHSIMIDVSGGYDIRDKNGEDTHERFDEQVIISNDDVHYKRDWNQFLSITKQWVKLKRKYGEVGSLAYFNKKQELDTFLFNFITSDKCDAYLVATEMSDYGTLFDFQIDNIIPVGKEIG